MPLRVLILGGTGLISVGIIKHLLRRGATVTCFNRGKSVPRADEPLPDEVRQVHGDRDAPGAIAAAVGKERFDAIIDMICFRESQAQVTADLCRGRAGHLIFCSTVCTYGTQVPPGVVVDETFPQAPTSDYARGKLACERLLLDANQRGDFATTVIRPSQTYGEGGPLIDQLEGDGRAWDRIRRGLPVLCAGDGLGLWNSTHRDDVGKLFSYAVGNERTFGQCYNATTQRIFTWREYHREAAEYFGRPANLLFMPADWIVAHDPKRFGLLDEITRHHGPYTSAKAMRDVPEFRCELDFKRGAARALASLERRGALAAAHDPLYERMVAAALAAGVAPTLA